MATVLGGTASARSISLNRLAIRAPIRPVQKLYSVNYADVQPAPLEALLELEGAAWVPAHHHLGPRLFDALDLPIEKLLGQLGIEEIIDAGASTTEVRLLQLDQLESRDRFQDRPGLLADPLTMREVAGVVVRDGELQRPEPAVQWNVGQELGDIAHLLAESLGPLCVLRVGMEQLPVLFHDRAAPRRVDRHEIHVSSLEDVDGLPRQSLGLFPLSLVD